MHDLINRSREPDPLRPIVLLTFVAWAFASPAAAQSNNEALIEAFQTCLSKSFVVSSDCSYGSCRVLRGTSGTVNFPTKVGVAAEKLKDTAACFTSCQRDSGCFRKVIVEAVTPFQRAQDAAAVAGVKITGKADFTAAFRFECEMIARTSVSGKDAGAFNSFSCMTRGVSNE